MFENLIMKEGKQMMKFLQIPLEMLEDTNLTGNDFKILCLLMRYQNKDTKQAYPSIEKIATDTGISVATIKRSIKRLHQQNYFSISKKKCASGKYNIYSDFKYTVADNNTKTKSTSNSTNNKVIGFNNFKPRDYDYDDLEKKLLGWD